MALTLDPRTGRSSPGSKLVVKSCAFLALLAGAVVWNGVTHYSSSTPADGSQAQRLLAACAESGESAGGMVVFHILGVLYMFVALAIVCDEYFVPALEVISGETKWNLSNDIAGATLMAAGGSAPELFTSLLGTFQESSVGFGTIVGSAVFNVMFVIGVCAVASTKTLSLNWWPLFRDCTYYAICLGILAVFMSDQIIEWWEAFILLSLYGGYVAVMAFNKQIYAWILANLMKKDSVTITLLLAELEDNEECTLNKPTGFRAGLYQFMTGKGSLSETAGTAIVTQIAGDVNETFAKIDTNGSGTIEITEIGSLLQEVCGDGAKVSPDDIKVVMNELDKDKDGEVNLAEFTTWYLASETRLEKDVKDAFTHFDGDKSGSLTVAEVKFALKELNGASLTDAEIDEAILAMTKGDANGAISFQNFSTFYTSSPLKARRESVMAEQAETSKGLVLWPPPADGGVSGMVTFFVTWPLIFLMKSIPDVRRPGWQDWCFTGFFMAIAWIGVFSYFMVGWATTIGDTFKIPPVIMGLTFLAAGTSVPDLLSSVIVAKQGHGDMAVSSSIGSNIFDILVGLPFPWLAYIIYKSAADKMEAVVVVGADNLGISIGILIGMLFVVVGSIAAFGWKLSKNMGYTYFVLYFVYVGQEIARNECLF
ncbi:hypothetical protein TeGR_g5935 [Tetraparma gracilis]|uniref:EF-hand domain-containing protein n=1 Tax=Tetraparma gracilis TaxID=2962635 RepID=A0ABQ6MW65_9STRA|nr:hypothetical protein TeGR_g5935 [Tetraparma gracilis]